MASREEYTSCMKPYITGKGKEKEQRRLDFCMGAKICSGKAVDETEAKNLCLEAPKQESSDSEAVKVTIDGKSYMLPRNELQRICKCDIKKPKEKEPQTEIAESTERLRALTASL